MMLRMKSLPRMRMKKSLILRVCFAGVVALASGCGGGATTGPTPTGGDAGGESAVQKPRGVKPGVTSGASASKQQVALASSATVAPAGAKFTILCAEFAGPTHVQLAREAKDRLTRTTGRSDFHVLYEQSASRLYLGFYKERDASADPAEAARMTRDVDTLREMKNALGERMFRSIVRVPLPVADPDAPPEYDLTKLDIDKAPDDPTRRYWSIAIAAYTADGDPSGPDIGKTRKQLAVESVIEARRMGYEAYFYHGENISTVCIGAWPRAALAEQEMAGAQSRGDNNQALVVSGMALPQTLVDSIENSGRDVKVFQPKVDVQDASLLQSWQKFPTYAVNGQEQINMISDPNTGKRSPVSQPTFLFVIPRQQPSVLTGSTPTADEPPMMLNPMSPSGGGLRSVPR